MKNKNKPRKSFIKKAFYKGRLTRFRKLVNIMLVTAIVCSALSFVKCAYDEYAAARAHIILNYSEIAQSRYPDGSRFAYYDIVSDENLEAALEIMKKNGKYTNFTVDDIRNSFFIYSYLDSSAGETVNSVRSEGNDFSYVANEYKVTFFQPHDYKEKDISKVIFGKDYSQEFLQVLVDVNKKNIAETRGGIRGFEIISESVKVGDYDYSEEVDIYITKINNINSYLKTLEKEKPGFESKKHGMSLSELRGKYNFLITNRLDGINSFVESSGISKDVSLASNKIKVNIENNDLKLNKSTAKSEINNYAMENYDQTFTENLINVIRNDNYGLYQARPKTAFDTVSTQKFDADEGVAEYGAKINVFSTELNTYETVMTTPEEHKRLTDKCDTLIADFRAEYDELTAVSLDIVREYFNYRNENYVSSKITSRNFINKNLIIKLGASGAIGAVIAFIVVILVSSYKDGKKLKEKKKQIKEIKKNEQKEEA